MVAAVGHSPAVTLDNPLVMFISLDSWQHHGGFCIVYLVILTMVVKCMIMLYVVVAMAVIVVVSCDVAVLAMWLCLGCFLRGSVYVMSYDFILALWLCGFIYVLFSDFVASFSCLVHCFCGETSLSILCGKSLSDLVTGGSSCCEACNPFCWSHSACDICGIAASAFFSVELNQAAYA